MSDEVEKSSARKRADEIKSHRCKNFIAVIEDPTDIKNIGAIIRNVNALGVEKVYVVDPRNVLPADWQEMRENKSLSKPSASAVKWSFVRRFDNTEECLSHLERKYFISLVTSPHVKGANNASLDEVDFTVYSKLAIWFGNESKGISDLAVERSKLCISIPTFGMIESLNMGTSSGIILYEAAKQRRKYQATYKRSKKRKRISDA